VEIPLMESPGIDSMKGPSLSVSFRSSLIEDLREGPIT